MENTVTPGVLAQLLRLSPEARKVVAYALLDQEEPKQDKANDAKLKAQQAEIERLKAQLAQAQSARPMSRNDAEVVRKAAEEAASAGIDPWSITVNIRSPRRRGNEDPWYWLNVNGNSVQIPAAAEYEGLTLDGLEVYDPVTNPHKE